MINPFFRTISGVFINLTGENKQAAPGYALVSAQAWSIVNWRIRTRTEHIDIGSVRFQSLRLKPSLRAHKRAYPGDLLSYIPRGFEDLIFRYQNQIRGCTERHIGIGRAH